VRVINADGSQLGILHPNDAMKIADQQGLDLVEISPTAQPPVCRIMNFGKFKYEQDQKHKDARKKQAHVKVKEMKFHPNVDIHDYETKLRHIREFIEEGNRVRCSLQFRGRETSHTELGFQLFDRIIRDMAPYGHPEQRPNLQGRLLSMMMVANKNVVAPSHHGPTPPSPHAHGQTGPGPAAPKASPTAPNPRG
jgi:translation initiation factor IF-3